MASPVGHALVGMGLAAVVAQVADIPASPAFWIGAIIASNVPDLDMVGLTLGLPFHRLHRRATHSLVTLGLLTLAAWSLSILLGGIEPGLGLAWVMALLSHPLLDVVTTGPRVAAKGFGIPLLWPLYSRRWYLQQPIFLTAEFNTYRSARGAGQAILHEIYQFGPVCIGLILLGHLFF